MQVMILGSGVIGVSCAWQLALAGHEVIVLDRQPAAGMETSYANAGEVSPGYSAPWAGPGVPLKAIKWLLMAHRPLVLRPHLDLGMVRWGFAMLRNCTASRYELNKSRMVRLAEYSRDCLVALRAAVQLRSIARTQLTRCQSKCGRMTSGRWCISSHLTAFSGTPGPAHGAEYPGEISPAFAKLVSSAGRGCRSIRVT